MKPFYLGTLLGVLSLACCGAPSQQVLRLEKREDGTYSLFVKKLED